MPLDPYEQLGVARDANATQIKQAWREKIRACHPDRNPDDPHAATRAALVNEAYEILSDRQRRLAYDQGDSENPQALLSAAREMIITRFRTLLNGKTPSATGRIIHDVGAELRAEKNALLASKAEGKRCNASINHMRKRYRRRSEGAVDFLADELDSMIAHNNRQLQEADKALKAVALAIKLLADFEDVTDDEKAVSRILLGSIATSATTW